MVKKPDPIHMKEDDKKKRTCLKCQKEFMSIGPGNRICAKCNSNSAKYYDKEVFIDSSKRSGRVIRKSINKGSS